MAKKNSKFGFLNCDHQGSLRDIFILNFLKSSLFVVCNFSTVIQLLPLFVPEKSFAYKKCLSKYIYICIHSNYRIVQKARTGSDVMNQEKLKITCTKTLEVYCMY